MKKEFSVGREDYLSAGKVSSQIKATIKQIGLPNELLRRISVASYEAEINMIIHSYGGVISLEISDDKIILIFKDTGPGIEDIEKALTPGFSTASKKARDFGFGAGMGLPNIRRMSDSFDIKSVKEGTTLTIGFNLES